MKIKSVALLGAGAVGAYIIWGLSEVKNIEFGIVAEGSRKERLERDGIGINGQVYHPKVWTPDEAKGVDLLIVALKYGALDGALDSIDTIAGKNTSGTTTVMSLMNGVDSEEIISTRTGMKPILHSLIKVASHKEDDGYHFDPETTIGIVFGELKAPFDSDRVKAVSEIFESGGIHYRATEYIREEMWSKFRLNVCNNLLQAVISAGVGCYRDSIHIDAVRKGLRAVSYTHLTLPTTSRV